MRLLIQGEEENPLPAARVQRAGYFFTTLCILCLLLGWSGSSEAFSARYGDVCEGLSAGVWHTCILTSGGNVECSGGTDDIDFGQAEDYSGGDAAGVSAGGFHTCVLIDSGNVQCYGLNDDGQAKNYTGGNAVGLSAGRRHTCVLTIDGNVDCYGNNSFQQGEDYLSGDAIGVSAGDSFTCVLTEGGNVDCYGLTSEGLAGDYMSGDAAGVSAGKGHTCVLTEGGNVDCYGVNDDGQAGDYTSGDALGATAGGSHSCVLTSGGNVECFGDNFYGQAGGYDGGDGVCSRCGQNAPDAMPVPSSPFIWSFPPIVSPVLSAVPSQARPVGIGSAATGGNTLSVHIGLNPVSEKVDVYGAFRVSTDRDRINVLRPDGVSFSSFSLTEIQDALATGRPPHGADPWQANALCPVDVRLFDLPLSGIPPGLYEIFLLVTPAGSLENYYLWITSFSAD